MEFGLFELISTLVNVVLGGGLFVTMITLRSQKKKVAAEASLAEAVAESSELDNAEKIARMWRENFEALNLELKDTRLRAAEMALQVEALRKEASEKTRLDVFNQEEMFRLEGAFDDDNVEEWTESADNVEASHDEVYESKRLDRHSRLSRTTVNDNDD